MEKEVMQSKVLETLDKLGFKTEELENNVYSFNYENTKLLFFPKGLECEMLLFCVPGIFYINEESLWISAVLMEKINNEINFIKSYMLDEHLALFYEREMIDNADLEETIIRMVIHLHKAQELALFYAEELMEKFGPKNNTASDEEDDWDDDELEDDDPEDDDPDFEGFVFDEMEDEFIC